MPFTIEQKNTDSIPVDVSNVPLTSSDSISADDLLKSTVRRGRKQIEFGELFSVKPSNEKSISWTGDLKNVHGIGSQWSDGVLKIDGTVGDCLGQFMTGGKIELTGNAQSCVGMSMKKGQIHVSGNVGDHLGCPAPGSRKGMTGGEILVHGNAGNEIGYKMRRGLIAIAGKSGNAAGVNCLAGSIFLFGPTGERHGYGMKRGTIGLFNDEAAKGFQPSVGFQHACRYQPNFLRVYLKTLSSWGFPVASNLIDDHFDRYCGDRTEMNRGEILVRVC